MNSLVLAGGGMRVAWQAGVMTALAEEGLEFSHVDGTSGGIINTAMMLSGATPAEMCERWITLKAHRFVSPLRLSSYLRGPTQLKALGDADSVIDYVFPHLGIDVAAIRQQTKVDGTFNVCNFDDKTCEAIPHAEIDLDLLVAGISLPVAMPVVTRGGVSYTDAVWVQDANLLEAVRRGADELWLLWCIGNTPRYGAGPLEQYVHMIEMSANGALFAEMARIAELNAQRKTPIRVHVVKPTHPLPLDPMFFLGRIDAHTLCAMGYHDAKAYLSERSPEGVALTPDSTKMTEPPLGVRYRECLTGEIAGFGRIEVRLAPELADGKGRVVGSIQASSFPARKWLHGGRVSVDGDQLVYRATAGDHDITVRRRMKLSDLRQVHVSIDGSEAPFAVSGRDALRALLSIEPDGAHGLVDRVHAIRSFLTSLRGSKAA